MTIKTVVNIRRLSQVLFFGIFFWLILKTNFEVNFNPDDLTEIILPYPVSIALEFSPLVALATLLANGTVFKGLLWSLVILIPTIFLGRFFCGWICPLGTLNHWISEIRSERMKRKGKKRILSNKYKKYQRIKYYIFFSFIAASFVGTVQVGLFDPLSFLARSLGTVVLPTAHTAANAILGSVKSIGLGPLTGGAQFIYDLISPILLPFRQAHFHTILTIATLFIGALVMNRIYTRFWCRGICPLGAMLGIFSKYAIFGLEKNEERCDDCQLCQMHCQGADNPKVGEKWRQTECHLCLNCQSACPQSSLKFKFYPNQIETKTNPVGIQTIDISRRKVFLSVGSGLALYPLLRSGDDFDANANPFLIRPPGSVEEKDFLTRCIRCGQCMRVCPNNALHPTFMESGLEGLWSPTMIPKIGYCEPTCTLCGQVCPTGAILELTQKDKVGDEDSPPNRIGTAFFDRGRCLPWAMGKPCIVCEEWCPTSPKAIYLKEETVLDSEGKEVLVKRPYIDPALCTGCGACEYACPVMDKRAVYVTSVGESRSQKNQILLQRKTTKRKLADNN
ncbi:MAG: 4Fe-4S dicluster domain-containing protein [candidate division Zixibacteria bacterium]|nr:4Fe-4S dicluster domain-containing protein [candidate division Zixibacteria bacterium]